MKGYDQWKTEPPPEPAPVEVDVWVSYDDSSEHPWHVSVETAAPAKWMPDHASTFDARPSYRDLMARWPVLEDAVVTIRVERA